MLGSHNIALLFVLMMHLSVGAQEQRSVHWERPPNLIVGMIVDQMRTDLIYRYWDNFGEDGFKRLVRDGAFLRDAHFDYSPTNTGPGHASVHTGTTPAFHGIVSNDMFLRSTGGGLYCASDPSILGIGCEGNEGQRSPVNMMSSTMADELEKRTAHRSRTIGVALKDRGSILPIGRMGDAAYWFSAAEGKFISSSWYMDSLPGWLVAFNQEGRAAKYLDRKWELLLPRERYLQVLPDDNPYEKPIPGTVAATLPLDLTALPKENMNALIWTPWGNTLTTDIAIAAIVGEKLGQDQMTDLLSISYSSTDMLAHYTTIRSLELEDMYVRLDLEMARLLKELDDRVGKGEYLLFLTADHGGGDQPEYLKDLRASATSFDQKELRSVLEPLLVNAFGTGDWIMEITNDQVFLNGTTIASKKLEAAAVQRVVAEGLLHHPLVAYALTATDLTGQVYAEGPQRSVQRGFHPQRSGDVCFVLRPGVVDVTDMYEAGKGSTHGSVWNYDTHVPIIFFGKGIAPGEVLRPVSITDIAPTIAMLVGTTMPDACVGRVIEEVIAR